MKRDKLIGLNDILLIDILFGPLIKTSGGTTEYASNLLPSGNLPLKDGLEIFADFVG